MNRLSLSALALPALVLTVSLSACGGDRETSESAEAAAPATAEKLASLQLSEQATADLQAYEAGTEAFINALDNGADAETLTQQAKQLLALGVGVVPEYVEVFPGCKAHLEAAAKIKDMWQTMDPEVIETDYHQDEALPEPPDGVDCYHMKDVVVHPATALALLAQDTVDRQQVRNEMEEVGVHAMAVRTGVGYNSGDGD